ncbi:MAG TPA: AbrB/MazE/SpoVT family DNA-binding domain-containing protein [Thermodesulfobacteriota bacterium]|jgi:antitoxin MazE|nr:AbrB/MazE/SpoVT family DNA-binding domain-containing protein [Thermodesulfobacteriota bacterium]
MVTKIQKWGNSQGLRVSKYILEKAKIEVGDEVDMTVKDGKIIIKSVKPKRGKKKLEQLVSKIDKNYNPSEEDWGAPVGKEVW